MIKDVSSKYKLDPEPRLLQRRRSVRVQRPASSVADLLSFSVSLRQKRWQRFRVKDGQKGPMIWEAKCARWFPVTAEGDPGWPVHLVVARYVLEPAKVKYFISNAAPETSLETLLKVAFARWHVERCFEDEKTELGFDHYEGRNYRGLLRHQALTAVTHLFLARVREQWRGEKPGVDRLPTPHRSLGAGAVLVAGPQVGSPSAGPHGRHDRVPATPERQGAAQPHQANSQTTPCLRHSPHRFANLACGMTVRRSVVVLGTTFGEVVCLTAGNGEMLWKVNIGEQIEFQPVVAKGRVYVSTSKGGLYCLETGDSKDDGWQMWGANAAHNGLLK